MTINKSCKRRLSSVIIINKSLVQKRMSSSCQYYDHFFCYSNMPRLVHVGVFRMFPRPNTYNGVRSVSFKTSRSASYPSPTNPLPFKFR